MKLEKDAAQPTSAAFAPISSDAQARALLGAMMTMLMERLVACFRCISVCLSVSQSVSQSFSLSVSLFVSLSFGPSVCRRGHWVCN